MLAAAQAVVLVRGRAGAVLGVVAILEQLVRQLLELLELQIQVEAGVAQTILVLVVVRLVEMAVQALSFFATPAQFNISLVAQ
jgi:hypothetical protein